MPGLTVRASPREALRAPAGPPTAPRGGLPPLACGASAVGRTGPPAGQAPRSRLPAEAAEGDGRPEGRAGERPGPPPPRSPAPPPRAPRHPAARPPGLHFPACPAAGTARARRGCAGRGQRPAR